MSAAAEMNMSPRRWVCNGMITAAIAVASGAWTPAHAQTDPETPAAAPLAPQVPASQSSQNVAPQAVFDGGGDIVVTAQRREKSLSKVPRFVSAFNADTLQTRVVTQEQDLAALVPGLVGKNGQNQATVSSSPNSRATGTRPGRAKCAST